MWVNSVAITSVDTAWTNIKAETAPNGGWTSKYKDRLKLWVKREEVYSAWKWYMTAQSWTFNDWAEAAEQLIAHVDSRPNRKREGKLAQKARKSEKLRNDLVAAMQTIGAWIDTTYPGPVRASSYSGAERDYTTVWAYLEQFRGQYRNWYPNGSIQNRMRNPKQNGMSSNFVMLREIYYALASVTEVNDAPNTTAIRPAGARYGTGLTGARVRIDKEDDNPLGETRREDFTPETGHDWVKNAQVNNMALGAGASNTTDGILYMANLAGVGADGKQAIAWAAFVFWNKRYYKIQGYGHTFHEVMDVAHEEHGVAYTGALPAVVPT
jgi:hypothetical protein